MLAHVVPSDINLVADGAAQALQKSAMFTITRSSPCWEWVEPFTANDKVDVTRQTRNTHAQVFSSRHGINQRVDSVHRKGGGHVISVTKQSDSLDAPLGVTCSRSRPLNGARSPFHYLVSSLSSFNHVLWKPKTCWYSSVQSIVSFRTNFSRSPHDTEVKHIFILLYLYSNLNDSVSQCRSLHIVKNGRQ